MLFMNRCLHFSHSQPSPHPLSQRDKHCSRSERGARSSNYQQLLRRFLFVNVWKCFILAAGLWPLLIHQKELIT